MFRFATVDDIVDLDAFFHDPGDMSGTILMGESGDKLVSAVEYFPATARGIPVAYVANLRAVSFRHWLKLEAAFIRELHRQRFRAYFFWIDKAEYPEYHSMVMRMPGVVHILESTPRDWFWRQL